MPTHRSHVHDCAALPAAHVGQDTLHQARQPEEVDFKLPARLVDGHIFHRAVRTVAGIVHQHVDAPFGADDFGHSGLDAFV